MKGFIEVERRSDKFKGKELLAVASIVSVYDSDIMLNAIEDNGYTQSNYVVPTKHTYEEIKQKIAEAIGNE